MARWLIRCCQGITFYENHFEKQMLIKTKEYYMKESSAFLQVQVFLSLSCLFFTLVFLLQTGTVSDYMMKAEQRIRKEEENGVFYFLPTTKPKLKLALDEVIVPFVSAPWSFPHGFRVTGDDYQAL